MNKDRTARQKNVFKKIGASIMAMALVVAMVVGLFPSEALGKASDLDTSLKYSESLGSHESTEFAGRVWTDKSVYSESKTYGLYGGGEATIDLDKDKEDFLVAYSLLASSQEITGSQTAPLDVVFVIDLSSSMVRSTNIMDNGQTRLYNMVQALNASVKELVSLNEYVRIGVMGYNNTSRQILPLDTYRQYGNREFFTVSGSTITYNAIGTRNTYNSATISTSSGTNIQKGLYEGMRMLTETDSTRVNINGKNVDRVPSLILLTDGEPSIASTQATWWDLSRDNSQPSNTEPRTIYGMKALMTAAYMKKAVDNKYASDGVANDISVYSIGMGITGVSNNYRPFCYATINPNDSTLRNSSNSWVNDMRTLWNNYANDRTATLGGYTFTHPEDHNQYPGQIDIVPTDKDISALYYVDAYYDADNAEAVNDVFSSIVSSISLDAADTPTELKGDRPVTEDGFITYTDPLGKYMELKDMKAILYAGTKFTNKTAGTPYIDPADGLRKTEYVFTGEVHSPVYGDQNIANIDIILSENTITGDQTVTIKVPAAVIPVHVNSVTLDSDGNVTSHTNNGTFPARVIYSVGLKDGILKDGVVQTDQLSEEYIAANTDEETGRINFYSNLYTGNSVSVIETEQGIPQSINRTVGNATVEFEPAHSNSFYYIQENMAIYHDDQCQNPVLTTETLQDNVTYYYHETYYEGLTEIVKHTARTGLQLKQTDIVAVGGQLYRAAGSPRLNRIMLFEGRKVNNSTNTADDFYTPTFVYADHSSSAYDGFFRVYLGNNGVLSEAASGNLAISKNVVLPDGVDTALQSGKTFEFTIDFDDNNVATSAYAYDIVDAEGTVVSHGTIADDGEIYLKHGETAIIKNLPHGTTYTVVEGNAAGYTTTANGVQTNTASGTITAGETNEENFVNTYSFTPVTWPQSAGFEGKKVFTGRPWSDSDKFTFVLAPYNNAPLPAAAGSASEMAVEVTKANLTSTTEAKFEFGSIEFTKPGTYRYTIFEREPEATAFLPGVSYSRALYRVVITVVDDGDGTMSATSDIQRLYDDNATPLFTYDSSNNIVMNPGETSQDNIVFTNEYKVDSVVRVPVAVKHYTDNSGSNPLVSGKFEFKLIPVGYYFDDPNALVSDLNIPMPDDGNSATDDTVSTNEGINVIFNSVTFTQADLKGHSAITYKYIMKEVLPAGADASNNYTVNGMKYDPKEVQIEVKLWVDALSNILNVSSSYDGGRIAEFTNVYTPNSDSLALKATKLLTGRTLKANDSFTFELTAANEAAETVLTQTATATATVEGGAFKDAVFSELTFTKPDTYEFDVKEVLPAEATAANGYTHNGITYDTHTSKVVVTVVDNNGQLEATPVYDGNATNLSAKFTNTYDATFTGPSINLNGTKDLVGRDMNPGEFIFTVEPQGNAPMGDSHISNVVDVNTKKATLLKNITFDEAGTYVYRITEQHPAGATATNNYTVNGVTYDATIYEYTVNVKDVDQVGRLTVTGTSLQKSTDGGSTWAAATELEPTFHNVYTASGITGVVPSVTKVLSGDRNHGLEADEFTFNFSIDKITDLEGNPVDLAQKIGEYVSYEGASATSQLLATAKNAADGSIALSGKKVTFHKEGIYTLVIAEEVPATNKVPGVEYTAEPLVATYRVIDNGQGQLVATVIGTTGSRTFVNEYKATAPIQLKLAKDFDRVGGWVNTDEFEFEVVILDPDTQAAVDAGHISFPQTQAINNIQTVVIDDESPVLDAATPHIKTEMSPVITVNKPGTYKFRVHEVAGSILGVNYTDKYYDVVVSATDNGNGTLTVSYTTTSTGTAVNPTLTFENDYVPGTVELSGHSDLYVLKEFTGRPGNQWLSTDEFTFELSAYGVPTNTAVTNGKVVLPATTLEVTNANKAYPHFGNIIFKEVGTYQFKIRELQPAGAVGNVYEGITYDTSEYVVTVKVSDNHVQGVLEIEDVAYEKLAGGLSTDAAAMEFKNEYHANEKPSAPIQVEKAISGRYWKDGDNFSFTLRALDEDTINAVANGTVVLPANTDGVVTEKITYTGSPTNANQTATFDAITFKAVGTYRFEIAEVLETMDNMTYDSHHLYVTIVVTDNGTGELQVAAPVFEGEETFTNVYTPSPFAVELQGKKVLGSTNAVPVLEDGDYRFSIEAVLAPAGVTAPLPAITTAVNGVSGSASDANPKEAPVKFGAILLPKEGTYEYKIREIEGNIAGVTYDSSVITATVVVNKDAVTGLLSLGSVTYTGADTTQFVFTNTYNTTPTDAVVINASKMVTPVPGHTYTMAGGEFQFKIVDPNGVETTVYNAQDGSIALLNESFDKTGTFEYTVSEVPGLLAGIGYDGSVFTITVTVKDNVETGKLEATYVIKKNGTEVREIVFDNAYDPNDAYVTLQGHKQLISSHKNLEANEFDFHIEAVTAGAPMPAATTVKNTASGFFSFSTITYTHTGVYEYEISEVNAGKNGYTYDGTDYKVVVTVSDVSGHLKADVAITNAAQGQYPILFTNTYDVTATTTSFSGTKVLNGESIDHFDNKFEFALLSGTNEVATAKNNDANFTIALPNDYFTSAGTYNFTIVEKNTGVPGIVSYDGSVYAVEVVVVDENYGGTLKVDSVKYFKDGSEVQSVAFENTYDASGETEIALTKNLDGRNMKPGEFKFELSAITPGAPMPAKTTVENTSSAVTESISFGKIQFDNAGTYEYKIVEIDTGVTGIGYDEEEYFVTVKVEDKAYNGAYDVSVSIKDKANADQSEVEFNNTYKALSTKISLNGTKFFENGTLKAGDYTFVVRDVVKGTEVPVKNAQNGNIVFLNEEEITEAGTYTYYFMEVIPTEADYDMAERVYSLNGIKYDATAYKYTVVVEDVNGQLTVTDDTLIVVDRLTDQFIKDAKAVTFTNEFVSPLLAVEKEQAVNDGQRTKAKAEVTEGDIVTYYITVSNRAKYSVADDITVEDAVPAGLVVDEASISNGGKLKDGVITWTIDELAGNADVTLSFRVSVPDVDAYKEWKNIATIVDNGDEQPSEEVVIYEYAPHLAIEKSQKVNSGKATQELQKVEAGDKVTYIVKVTNNGTEAAKNVTVTDKIPEGLKLVADSISEGGKEVNGVVTWTFAEIAKETSKELTFTVEVPTVDNDTTWKNIATFVYGNDPTDPEEPEESNEVVIETEYVKPELVIEKLQSVNGGSKTKEQQQVVEDDIVTYYLKVKNNTAVSEAKDVIITDVIPKGLELVNGSITANGVEKDGVITWYVGALEGGKEVEVSFSVKVPDVDADTVWANVATVEQLVPTDDPTDNPDNKEEEEDDSNEVEIKEGVPALTISKLQRVNLGKLDAEKKDVRVGDIITYSLIVANNGTEAAKSVVVKDKLPEGLTVIKNGITRDGKVENGVVIWTIDEIKAGEQVILSVAVKVPAVQKDTVYKNVATATYGNNPDDTAEPEVSNEVVIDNQVTSPQMGDSTNITTWAAMALASLAVCIKPLIPNKKTKKA